MKDFFSLWQDAHAVISNPIKFSSSNSDFKDSLAVNPIKSAFSVYKVFCGVSKSLNSKLEFPGALGEGALSYN